MQGSVRSGRPIARYLSIEEHASLFGAEKYRFVLAQVQLAQLLQREFSEDC